MEKRGGGIEPGCVVWSSKCDCKFCYHNNDDERMMMMMIYIL